MTPKRKKRRLPVFILLLLLPAAAVAAWLYRGELLYFWYSLRPAPTYKSFGVNIPQGYTTLGVDVSRYQGAINWTALSETRHQHLRLSFAYIKATEGDNITDPFFEVNALAGKRSRLFTGAYHFYRFIDTPEAQTELFAKRIGRHRFTLPPVIDVEDDDGIDPLLIRKDLKKALILVQQKTGRKPIIYTSPSFYKKFLNDGFDDYDFWLAHYYVNRPLIPGGMKARIWQFTDKATIDGINTPVDLNVYLGNYEEFTSLIHQ